MRPRESRGKRISPEKEVIGLSHKSRIVRPGRETRTAPMTDLDRLKKAFLISRQVIRAKGEFALAQQLISLYGARLKLTAAMVRDAVLKWMQNGTIVRTSSRGLYLYKPA